MLYVCPRSKKTLKSWKNQLFAQANQELLQPSMAS